MNKSKILFASGIVIATAIISLVFVNSSMAHKRLPVYNPAFNAYLSAFTVGEISKQSAIKVRFQDEMVDETVVGNTLEKHPFTFEPAIDGSAKWIDAKTLVFEPTTVLTSGEVYISQMEMTELFPEIAPELSDFSFHFRAKPQHISLELLGSTAAENSDDQWYAIEGNLVTTDIESAANIEEIFSAKIKKKALKVKWTHEKGSQKHYFKLDSIPRSVDPVDVLIDWDGKKIGVDSKGSETVAIPALGNFTFSKVSPFNGDNQYLLVEFSDRLDRKQNLEGLVRLNGHKATFSIHRNRIKIFPKKRIQGDVEVNISAGIKNHEGHKIQQPQRTVVNFAKINPQLKLVRQGVIIPQSKELPFLFEAIGLNAVDVRIIRIFENDIPQFLQVNRIGEEKELKRVGRIVASQRVPLNESGKLDLRSWNTHAIDLGKLIAAEPGAIYQVAIGFQKAYYVEACEEEVVAEETNRRWGPPKKKQKGMLEVGWDWDTYEQSAESSYWDWWYDGYYEDRENPCKNAFYHDERAIKRNVLASDLGVIAKRGSGNTFVAVTDLKTTAPKEGVKVEIFNYQQQLMESTRTDADGMAEINIKEKPYLLIATAGNQRGYLRLDDGTSLSLSQFDVQGATYHKGIKGFLYGERGVWRPGDEMYLNFILEDKDGQLPASHPVTFELFNPQGQQVAKTVRTESVNGFYNFATKTAQDAPTGNYLAKVSVGGAEFQKTLKVETIMPNRLKLMMDFGEGALSNETSDREIELEVKWLHGAIAKNLKAEVKATLKQAKTRFSTFSDYEFDDPVRRFRSEEKTLLDGFLDEKGLASFTADLAVNGEAPGMLTANVVGRVYEPGGNASTDRFSMPFHPYDTYVGVKLPKGDAARGMLLTDIDHTVDIVTLDKNGKPVSRQDIQVEVYQINWKWWWDKSSDDDLGAYVGKQHRESISSGTVSTTNGKGKYTLRVEYPSWGRYLVRVTDPGGHSTGKIVYIDWPGWAGRAQGDNPGGAQMLSFSTDKPIYQLGEDITLTIPSSGAGRALVSVESGTQVLNTYWVKTQKGATRFSLPTIPAMSPNAYVHVTLLQPHAQTANDLPMRLYGVMPVKVENPATILSPQITMADVLEPMAEVEIKVNERNGGPMTYTLAVVDEGLLGLTRFRTPNPHTEFYKRQALQVKTWDLFNDVVGAYGGEFNSLLSIGGGEGGIGPDGKKQDRFKPVVKVFGPFSLAAGKTNTHKFMMPNYVGAVRTMVVAGNNGAYGFAEKETPVKKPLMVLGSLPRVLGPGETLNLPVTVFAMEDYVKDVSISVETGGAISAIGGNNRSMQFTDVGEKMANFGLQVNNMVGKAKVRITAKSGSEVATYETDVEVRAPNPRVVDIHDAIVESGLDWRQRIRPVGIAGTNHGVLEVSSIPPLNLERRLKYLVRYPYGCIEQTTSGAFPQLFLANLLKLSPTQKAEIDKNVKAGIQRLTTFQVGNGGLSYWPGNANASEWGTNYAGHFMLEAEKAGYFVSNDFLKSWKKYQKEQAKNWGGSTRNNNDLTQAYRLYLLALAGAEELGAMNRMRQQTTSMASVAQYYLAAAYHQIGQKNVANQILAGQSLNIRDYRELGNTYGSGLRDRAMILHAMGVMGKRAEGRDLLQAISDKIGSKNWHSTHSTAWSLVAISKYVGLGGVGENYAFAYRVGGGKWKEIATSSPIWQGDLPAEDVAMFEFKNKDGGLLFPRVILDGVPAVGDTTDASHGLSLLVAYKDMEGNDVDVTKLEQGTDFVAKVTVIHSGRTGKYEELAIAQVFPSGWEIHNHRLDGSDPGGTKPEYQDIRDDRVYTFFDLDQGRAKSFNIKLNASYLGRYYLPTIKVEAMYDHTIHARKRGKWVDIVASSGN